MAELTQEALNKDGGELIGDSPVMQKLQREISLVAPSDYAILIEGETGVGKELIARTLHSRSNRSQGPLVYVNCAAIPENLVESELFGHVKGRLPARTVTGWVNSVWRTAARCFLMKSASCRWQPRASCCGRCKVRRFSQWGRTVLPMWMFGCWPRRTGCWRKRWLNSASGRICITG